MPILAAAPAAAALAGGGGAAMGGAGALGGMGAAPMMSPLPMAAPGGAMGGGMMEMLPNMMAGGGGAPMAAPVPMAKPGFMDRATNPSFWKAGASNMMNDPERMSQIGDIAKSMMGGGQEQQQQQPPMQQPGSLANPAAVQALMEIIARNQGSQAMSGGMGANQYPLGRPQGM